MTRAGKNIGKTENTTSRAGRRCVGKRVQGAVTENGVPCNHIREGESNLKIKIKPQEIPG